MSTTRPSRDRHAPVPFEAGQGGGLASAHYHQGKTIGKREKGKRREKGKGKTIGKREKGKRSGKGKREKGKGKRENAEAHRRLAVDQLD